MRGASLELEALSLEDLKLFVQQHLLLLPSRQHQAEMEEKKKSVSSSSNGHHPFLGMLGTLGTIDFPSSDVHESIVAMPFPFFDE